MTTGTGDESRDCNQLEKGLYMSTGMSASDSVPKKSSETSEVPLPSRPHDKAEGGLHLYFERRH